MEIYIAFSAFICIVGLLMYLFVDQARFPKAIEVGRIMFWTGLLAFMLIFKGCNGTMGIC